MINVKGFFFQEVKPIINVKEEYFFLQSTELQREKSTQSFNKLCLSLQ